MDGQNETEVKIPAKDFRLVCESLRKHLKDFAPAVWTLKEQTIGASKHTQEPGDEMHDYGEMIANLTLAFRHIEDASMRIGKAIQAYEGGKSPLDNSVSVK